MVYFRMSHLDTAAINYHANNIHKLDEASNV